MSSESSTQSSLTGSQVDPRFRYTMLVSPGEDPEHNGWNPYDEDALVAPDIRVSQSGVWRASTPLFSRLKIHRRAWAVDRDPR